MTGDEEWREALASPELSSAEAIGALAEGGPLRFTLLVRACVRPTSGIALLEYISEKCSEAICACWGNDGSILQNGMDHPPHRRARKYGGRGGGVPGVWLLCS